MLDQIKNDVTRTLVLVRIQTPEEAVSAEAQMQQSQVENVHYRHDAFDENATPEQMLAPEPLRWVVMQKSAGV
jgi:preprotein translocase subunit SecA